ERLGRHPFVRPIDLGRFLATVHFHPGDGALAAIGLLNCGVDDLDHDRRDIDTDTIAFNERDDGVIRYIQGEICIDSNFVTVGWHPDLLVSHYLNSVSCLRCTCPYRL